MRRLLLACARCLTAAMLSGASAQDLRPQHLTTKPAIDAGSNVFTIDQEWAGASSINVFGAGDLAYKGNLNGGTMAQMLISRDGKTAYLASVYMKRITYGEAEMVLQAFDVATLRLVREVALPPKFAMLYPYVSMLAESADGKYVYVQNATPATSVTVVDVGAGKVTGEIPTPGCFGIYPALKPNSFSVICGDGTFASYVLNADGDGATRTAGERIFDVDRDPIFTASQRVGEGLVFVSYHGNVYEIADDGPAPTLKERFSLTTGTHGNWAPGGFELLAYNRSNGVLFIGMHPDAKDGSHKTPAKEIWAYDLEHRQLLHRTAVHGVTGLTVSGDPLPVLFALQDKAIIRFDVDRRAHFALKQSHKHINAGEYATQVELRP
jgi:methylamine dehydrogenase heavy chain